MCKYGESKTTRIMMATVPNVTSGLGLKKISGRWIFVDTSVHLFYITWLKILKVARSEKSDIKVRVHCHFKSLRR